MSSLFSPLRLRDVTLRNRVAVSPMCEYSSDDGFANDWHVVHLGSRAVGGASLVLTEAIAVTADGRISPQDLGIWQDAHVDELARIARFCAGQGAAWGTQLAHAGRKASTFRPWDDGRGAVAPAAGGWTPVAPGTDPFDPTYPVPEALDEAGIAAIVRAFADGARRTLAAGGTVIEIHGAHGYLVHEFLSPLVNRRTDRWGGSFENRTRLPLEIVRAVRGVWPERLPLFVRLSATDWAADGWDVEQTVALARLLREEGVDLIDVSSGGAVPVPPGTIPAGAALPDAVRRARPARGRHLHRRGRHDHRARRRRGDRRGRPGRPGLSRARAAARPVLAAVRGPRARGRYRLAGAVSARRRGPRLDAGAGSGLAVRPFG